MSANSRFLCNATCLLASGGSDGGESTCAAKEKLQSALQTYYGFDEFRPGQLEVLLPIIHGRDTFVRMATGSGKSLCMFLGPLACGTTSLGVIISPLNGLMRQQVSY